MHVVINVVIKEKNSSRGWDSNPSSQVWTATWIHPLRPLGHQNSYDIVTQGVISTAKLGRGTAMRENALNLDCDQMVTYFENVFLQDHKQKY